MNNLFVCLFLFSVKFVISGTDYNHVGFPNMTLGDEGEDWSNYQQTVKNTYNNIENSANLLSILSKTNNGKFLKPIVCS